MPRGAPATQANPEGYLSNEEYLADQLRRLELLVKVKVREKQALRQLTPSCTPKVAIPGGPATLPPHGESSSSSGELQQLQQLIASREACTPAGQLLGLPTLAQIFNLTPLETDCLLACLAPEIDASYQRLYAELAGDAARGNPTTALLAELFCSDLSERVRLHAAFHPTAPLAAFRLLCTISPPETPFPCRALKLDDPIKDFLLGLRLLDHRVSEVANILPPKGEEAIIVRTEEHDEIRRAAVQHFSASESAHNLIICLHGPRGSGKKTLARGICGDLGVPLIVADLARLPEEALEETVWLLARETVLHSSALCLDGIDHCAALKPSRFEALLRSIQAFSRLTFLLAEKPFLPRGALAGYALLEGGFTCPDETMRREMWGRYLEKVAPGHDRCEIEMLAGKFRFTPGQIRDAALVAANREHCYPAGTFSENVYDACRSISAPGLGAAAGKSGQRSWDDIILPARQMAQMKELCDQAKYRKLVYGDWGFRKKLLGGRGLAALFAGPPGSGKTLAAEIIADELRLHLYKIDISRVVDKYVGETEKNLNRVFCEAERSNAVLFFDEADALFGKRSETRDAHDRYANIEVSYLLQRIEEYEGIVILATNLMNNMDEAFQRRMSFVLQFPFPDAPDRERIWRNIYPAEAPLGGDVDLPFLAERLKMCGGNIKNIAVASAFLAAGNDSPIGMKEIMKAAGREYQKMGKPLVHADFVPYAELLGED